MDKELVVYDALDVDRTAPTYETTIQCLDGNFSPEALEAVKKLKPGESITLDMWTFMRK